MSPMSRCIGTDRQAEANSISPGSSKGSSSARSSKIEYHFRRPVRNGFRSRSVECEVIWDGDLVPPAIVRGQLATTAMMEKLQDAYFRAVTAAAHCLIAKPETDIGIDWIVTHRSGSHVNDDFSQIYVQLKSTAQDI